MRLASAIAVLSSNGSRGVPSSAAIPINLVVGDGYRRYATNPSYVLGLIGVAEGLRFGDIQGAFIDRAAGDGADDAGRTCQQQLLDITEVMDAAGGDHWNATGRSQRGGSPDGAAPHHGVFGDIGINDGRYDISLEALGQVGGLHRRDFRPTVGGDEAIFGVQADNHLAGEGFAGVGDELRVFHRLGADDHVADAGPHVVLDGFQGADATANLDRQGRVALGDGGDHFAIDRLAFEGAIKVNQVQTTAAALDPLGSHAHRIIGKHRGVFHAALAQAHAGAVLQIDSGDNQHRLNLLKSCEFGGSALFERPEVAFDALEPFFQVSLHIKNRPVVVVRCNLAGKQFEHLGGLETAQFQLEALGHKTLEHQTGFTLLLGTQGHDRRFRLASAHLPAAIPGGEVLQQLQAVGVALFRVELHGKARAFGQRRGEILTVVTATDHLFGVASLDVIAVHEVETRQVRNVVPQRVHDRLRHLVPPHMRHLDRKS